MKKCLLAVLAVFASNLAAAAPERDPMDGVYCEMVADLAQKIVLDRNRGVSYKQEVTEFRQAKKNVPEFAKLNYPLEELINALYFRFSKLSPDAAYKIQYAACMRH